IAQFYSKQKYYDKAIVYLKKSIEISKKVGNKRLLMMCYEDLSELFYIKSEFREAYKLHLLFSKIKDEIFNKEKNRNITELEIKYKIREKEKEIEVQKLIIDRKNTLLLIYFISGIAILVIIFIILNLYRIRKKSNKILRENYLKITKQKDKLAELNATKNKFFSIIAHDLKNPFNTLLGFTNLLKNGYNELDDNERKIYVEQINNSSEAVFSLLQNLLQWSRTQINSIDLKKEKIDLYNLTNQTLALLQISAENKNINLQSNITPNTFVYADPNMTTTVIRNLISNAIKFTKEGGKILIGSNVYNNFVKVRIEDTGVGISNKDISKLFKIDSVFKTEGTQKEKGTGLGLIICKEFVEKNGGEIWVESKEGIGSTFIFTLPNNGS
ncbi:MAG: HAMP domain-containing histidine kinase, partial [Bacteroidales bacterium]|nr:HAMP domain-containing histidine kinase [Bacteroidales bacterium]